MEPAYFRHASGLLVSTLCRRFGIQHLEAVEDAVQVALLKAVETWPDGEPNDPTAWLYRVSHRALLDELRTGSRRRRLLAELPPQLPPERFGEPFDVRLEGELRDDLLCMLFVCCDPDLPVASQIAIALKTLCGFGVREIALRLFVAETAVYKRLSRARAHLRASPRDELDLEARRPVVLRVLHQLFTEGHLSTQAPGLRRDLCDEAIRLAQLLAEHSIGARPDTFALLALMHLHRARMDSRTDEAGDLLLLEEQDRSLWDAAHIQTGLAFLAQSAEGDAFSRYHAEAGIAAEHCLAPSFEATRWDRIIACYDQLEQVAPSPLHRLHRAVAVAAARGPQAGLEALEGDIPPAWLEGSYLWAAVLADLHRRCGDPSRAQRFRDTALELAPSEAARKALGRRLG